MVTRRKTTSTTRRRNAPRKANSYSSDESTNESEYERVSSRQQSTSRRSRGANAISYKEESENATGSDELVENDAAEVQLPPPEDEPEEKYETIEKILAQRRGKKKVTGNITTIYEVEDNGDPNKGKDPSKFFYSEFEFSKDFCGFEYFLVL